MQARRQVCRPKRKLLRGGERFELVAHMLRERLSPEPHEFWPSQKGPKAYKSVLNFNLAACSLGEKILALLGRCSP